MGMFIIEEHTSVRVRKPEHRGDWWPQHWIDHVTKHVQVFDKHEVVLDPTGKLGCERRGQTLGAWLERKGYYAFERDGWTLLVHASKVTYA